MSIEVHPRKIRGKWKEGYALDLHTTSSTFVGYDGYGHPQFDTTRSELGELLYKLKYGTGTTAVETLAEAAVRFLQKKWPIEVDLIVPVPPSNTARKRQPVLEVAKEISVRSGIKLCSSCIEKIKQTPQLKTSTIMKRGRLPWRTLLLPARQKSRESECFSSTIFSGLERR
jgi:predicted amidophosphoribosyltransferase